MTKNYKEFEYKTQILEHHLDTFGHVNNARYLDLYEEARWQFITKNGYGLQEIQKLQQGPVILDVTCRYKRELINREVIRITSKTLECTSKIMKIQQFIIKEDNALASEALFTIGFMDFSQRKLIDAPDLWLRAIGIL